MQSLKWAAIWFMAMALAGAVLLSICPWLMTSSYADITIAHITVDKEGHYTVGFSADAAARTTVITGFYDGAKYLGGGSDGHSNFFGGTTHETTGVMFGLDPDDVTAGYPTVPRPDRLLVHEGETRHLRHGERMYLFDFKSPDGMRHYGYIEVTFYRPPPPRSLTSPPKPLL